MDDDHGREGAGAGLRARLVGDDVRRAVLELHHLRVHGIGGHAGRDGCARSRNRGTGGRRGRKRRPIRRAGCLRRRSRRRQSCRVAPCRGGGAAGRCRWRGRRGCRAGGTALVAGAAADAAARVAAVVGRSSGRVVAKGVAVGPLPPQASSSIVAAASVPRAAVARIRKSRRPIVPAYHAATSDWTSGFSSVGGSGRGSNCRRHRDASFVEAASAQECTVPALSLSTPEIAASDEAE